MARQFARITAENSKKQKLNPEEEKCLECGGEDKG